MNSQLHILQHSLGLDQYGQGRQFRNHFVTGPGSKDYADCCALVEAGLMRNKGAGMLTGGDTCFVVTPAGTDFVALESPKRPPEPKRTRSQQRYRDFLASETSLSFAEWMGFGIRRHA